MKLAEILDKVRAIEAKMMSKIESLNETIEDDNNEMIDIAYAQGVQSGYEQNLSTIRELKGELTQAFLDEQLIVAIRIL